MEHSVHTALRWIVIGLAGAVWVFAIAGHTLPVLLIATGAVMVGQAAMIQGDWLGAASYYRDLTERRVAKAQTRQWQCSRAIPALRLPAVLAVIGFFLILLGVAGETGALG